MISKSSTPSADALLGDLHAYRHHSDRYPDPVTTPDRPEDRPREGRPKPATPRLAPVGAARKAGLSPGSMVFIGERKLDRATIDLIRYHPDGVHERSDVPPERCSDLAREPGVSWFDVRGVHDVELIETLGRGFDLHPLTLEDLVNTTQRLKVETFPDYLFLVLKMITAGDDPNDPAALRIEHVSLVLGRTYVISFQEREGDVFDTVRARIRGGKGRIRTMGPDYLAHALIDAVVDHYFVALERIGDRIETLDNAILTDPKPEHVHEIHRLKREILRLRKAVWPLREAIGTLQRSEADQLRPDTALFWRDLHDHTVQILELVESLRDLLGGMHDTYLSSLSARMNDVMKTLTIIATVFIPLTFVAGIYGMNFERMPELAWRWGYPAVWTVMLMVGSGLILWFKRRGWF